MIGSMAGRRGTLLFAVAIVVGLATGGGLAAATSSVLRFGPAPIAVSDDDGLLCYTNFIEGALVASDRGPVIIGKPGAEPTLVVWPAGYTARYAWGEIEVVDRRGETVARTGSLAKLWGAGGPFGGGEFHAADIATCGSFG